MIDFKQYTFEPLTLVYLIRDDQVLLLRRSSNKAVLPDKLLGLGGKIEPGEDVLDSARRETQEESGYIVKTLESKGVFTFIDQENDVAGIIYLFTCDDFSGIEETDNREGTLEWHPISDLAHLEDLAKHQLHFLPRILIDSQYQYAKTHVYTVDKKIEIMNEVPDFVQF